MPRALGSIPSLCSNPSSGEQEKQKFKVIFVLYQAWIYPARLKTLSPKEEMKRRRVETNGSFHQLGEGEVTPGLK